MEEKKIRELFELFTSTSNFFKLFIFKKNKTQEQSDLSMNQVLCLNVICLKKITTMSSIAKDIGISNQQLTRVIDDLVDKGYIERKRNEKNLRQVIAQPTPKATEFYHTMFKNLEERFYTIFNQLEDEKLENLIIHLKEIEEILNETKSHIINESTK